MSNYEYYEIDKKIDDMLSDDYEINFDRSLWPKMKWPYIWCVSPSQLLNYCRLGLPISIIMIFGMGWPDYTITITKSVIFSLIWLSLSTFGSWKDWVIFLKSGNWKGVIDEKYITDSGFIYNESSGRVYNKEEEKLVLEYRATHPGWWRMGEREPKFPYRDNRHFYCIKNVPGADGIWVTEDEYNMLEQKAVEESKNSFPFNSKGYSKREWTESEKSSKNFKSIRASVYNEYLYNEKLLFVKYV